MTRHLGTLLADACAQQPDRPALIEPAWSYRALSARVDSARWALREAGLRQGDRLAIAIPKSPRSLCLLLAALAEGAVAIPLDSEQPERRLRRQLEAAQPHVAALDRQVPTPSTARLLPPHWAEMAQSERAGGPGPPVPCALDQLALILFTSGSTGAPKGVMLSHRNVLHFVDWAIAHFGIGPVDILTSHAGLHFDLATLDIFGALGAGASICFLGRDTAAEISRSGATIVYMVPSAWRLLCERCPDALDLSQVRIAAFAGEVFPIADLRRLAARLPHAQLFNLYGPTETNVCTFHLISAADLAADRPPPIGRALPGVELSTRGDQLIVGGPGVSPGYWVDGAPGPLRAEHPTGDGVRADPAGWRFLGRLDRMIKLDGHRVEPAEIEAALLDGFCAQAAVVPIPRQGRVRLAACCVEPTDEGQVSALAMRAHIAQRLPRWMIPSSVHWLPEMPLTANGKVDLAALRERALDALNG